MHTQKVYRAKKKKTSNISFHFSGIAQEKKKQFNIDRLEKKEEDFIEHR